MKRLRNTLIKLLINKVLKNLILKFLAPSGIEPTLIAHEATVLPLHHSALIRFF